MFAVTLVLALDLPAFAQQPRDGRLIVTVIDPSGAVIPGATVTVTGIEDVTKAAAVAPAKTSDKGVATIDPLTPGRYAIHAEFPGFETSALARIDPGLLTKIGPPHIQA